MSADTERRCAATLALADDHGDNECTFTCGLPAGHSGQHVETFSPYGRYDVIVGWTARTEGEK